MDVFLLSWKARPKSETEGWLELMVVLDPLTESMRPAILGGFVPPTLGCMEEGGRKLLGKGRLGIDPILPMDDDVPCVAVTDVPRCLEVKSGAYGFKLL